MTDTSGYPVLSLAGKTILVTGGVRGIGLATALLAKRCGATVAVCDLSASVGAESSENSAADIMRLYGDVSNEEDADRIVSAVIGKLGHLDVLINNAGVLETTRPTPSQVLAEWRRTIDVNLQGTYLMARAAARAMVSSKRGGSIVNVASVTGLVGFRASNAYGVSKAAVVMLTKTLALDLAHKGIRVNAVAPGFIETAMTSDLQQDVKLPRDAFMRRVPMGRFGAAEEVARVIVFLASEWASYMTGSVVPVDGGWVAFGGAD